VLWTTINLAMDGVGGAGDGLGCGHSYVEACRHRRHTGDGSRSRFTLRSVITGCYELRDG
jgi:hypothetical protein